MVMRHMVPGECGPSQCHFGQITGSEQDTVQFVGFVEEEFRAVACLDVLKHDIFLAVMPEVRQVGLACARYVHALDVYS